MKTKIKSDKSFVILLGVSLVTFVMARVMKPIPEWAFGVICIIWMVTFIYGIDIFVRFLMHGDTRGLRERVRDSASQRMHDHWNRLDEFEVDYKLVGADGSSGIAFDKARQKICMINILGPHLGAVEMTMKNVISSEIIEDGSSLTKVSRSSQLAGVVVGGAILGGVGAIIGGLSGQKETTRRVRQLELHLLLDDPSFPRHQIKFLNKEIQSDSRDYQFAIGEARHWQGIVEAFIKQENDRQKRDEAPARLDSPIVTTSSTQSLTIADELRKLAELKDSGVLTPAEFQQQKEKLLAAN